MRGGEGPPGAVSIWSWSIVAAVEFLGPEKNQDLTHREIERQRRERETERERERERERSGIERRGLFAGQLLQRKKEKENRAKIC
jgi:hypothetical protein